MSADIGARIAIVRRYLAGSCAGQYEAQCELDVATSALHAGDYVLAEHHLARAAQLAILDS